MPRVATEVQDTYESITRPVAMTVARQVAELMGWSETINILFLGDIEEAAMPGSTPGASDLPSKFNNNGRIRLEITENAIEDRILATAVYQKEHLPIFVDKDLGIKLHPVYSGTEIVLQFQFRAPNRVLAKRFRDDALIKTAMGRKENLHELTYHYGLPPAYLIMLQQFHSMREAVAGYGEDFSVWVSNHITPRATNLMNLNGTQQQLVIGETQICPQGWFDFNAVPEPESKNDETGTWLVNFTYTLQFDKVIGIAAQWPLVIHNQLVDETYRDTPNASGVFVGSIDPDRIERAPSLSRFAFDKFTTLYSSACARKYGGVSIPEYDEWEPAIVHPNTVSIANVMLMVDLDDPTAIMDLHELGNYSIQADILAYLASDHTNLTIYGQSAVHLALYVDDYPMVDGTITVDANLVVRAAQPLNPRSRYHLRISVQHDLLSIPTAAQDKLRLQGPACKELLADLQFRLIGDALIPDLVAGKYVTRVDFLRIAQRINDRTTPYRIGIDYHMQTVGNFLIVTHRETDYADHGTQAVSTSGNTAGSGAGDGTLVSRCDG